MTVKIQREALLFVLQSSSNSLLEKQNQRSSGEDDEWVQVSIPKDDTDADDDSLCSLAYTETSYLGEDDLDTEPSSRRVSFCQDLVTEVRTRPRTEKDDIPKLFYSAEQIQRFRQEYRMERKLLSELDVDPDSCTQDLSELFFPSSSVLDQADATHHISRVVVLHNDKIETLSCSSEDNDEAALFDNPAFWSGSITYF